MRESATRMYFYLVVGCSVFVFYRIGEMDYGKGWLTATLSVVVSFVALRFLPLPWITVGLSQVALYLALLIFNLVRKTPPRL